MWQSAHNSGASRLQRVRCSVSCVCVWAQCVFVHPHNRRRCCATEHTSAFFTGARFALRDHVSFVRSFGPCPRSVFMLRVRAISVKFIKAHCVPTRAARDICEQHATRNSVHMVVQLEQLELVQCVRCMYFVCCHLTLWVQNVGIRMRTVLNMLNCAERSTQNIVCTCRVESSMPPNVGQTCGGPPKPCCEIWHTLSYVFPSAAPVINDHSPARHC